MFNGVVSSPCISLESAYKNVESSLMKSILLFALACLTVIASAQTVHIVHCLAGCPTGAADTNDLVVREIYALSNNKDTKFADWVAYRVTRETIGTSRSLDRDWENDELLDESATLETGDYTRAHSTLRTDRGHQAPLASFAGTHFWRVTNILSNVTPQKSELNQGPWARLESAVRDVAHDEGEVYVVTGPTYDSDQQQLELPEADETHTVPTGYFKVIALSNGRVSSFLFDQDENRQMDYCDGIVDFDDVETATGLDFFPRNEHWPTGNMDAKLGCE